MRTKPLAGVTGVAALVLAAGLWMLVPAWSQQATPARGDRYGTSGGMPGMGNGDAALIKDIAAARTATEKYATNLGAAKAAGYQILTKMMPNMGIHYLNPGITGFDVTKPPILVYEHTATGYELGALEWVFTSMPKTPPLPNATFGSFPAGCHYKDGTFVPDKDPKTCPKTAPGSGAKFFFWHPALFTMHFWVWYPNPAGLYSSTNPLVRPFNGG
jgi:hypothetical protein